jgi:hypothetical protein
MPVSVPGLCLSHAQYHDQATMKALEHLQQCSVCDPLNTVYIFHIQF